MVDFTKEEVNNLLILIDAGARSISSQNQLSKAAEVLAAAGVLSEKVAKLVKEKEEDVKS